MVCEFNRVTHLKHLYLDSVWLGLDQERTPKRHVSQEIELRILILFSISYLIYKIMGELYQNKY